MNSASKFNKRLKNIRDVDVTWVDGVFSFSDPLTRRYMLPQVSRKAIGLYRRPNLTILVTYRFRMNRSS